MSFRLILRIGVEVILLGLLTGSLVFVLSKLELKSEFLSRFCCGLLKLEGVSLIGFPSRKLFALAAQFSETQSGHVEYAAVAKLAVNTMRDKVTRMILDRVILATLCSCYIYSTYVESCHRQKMLNDKLRASSRMVMS